MPILYGPNDNYDDTRSCFCCIDKKFVIAKVNNFDEVICWETVHQREFYMLMIYDACVYCLENFTKRIFSYLNVGTGKI